MQADEASFKILAKFTAERDWHRAVDSGETELQASSGLRQAPFECSEEARCFTSGDGAMIESER
jgi:hypothetical protein